MWIQPGHKIWAKRPCQSPFHSFGAYFSFFGAFHTLKLQLHYKIKLQNNKFKRVKMALKNHFVSPLGLILALSISAPDTGLF